MCLGSILGMASAVMPSLMSSFFSHAPRLLPILRSNTIKSELSGHCASLSSSPCPLLSQTFWLQQPLSLYPKSPSRFSQQRGPSFCSTHKSLQMNPETVGIPAAHGRRRAVLPAPGSPPTGLVLERPLVHISKGNFSCKPSSHQIMSLAPSAQVPSAHPQLFSL